MKIFSYQYLSRSHSSLFNNSYLPPPQKSVPYLGSQRRRLAVASSLSWRLLRRVWTSLQPATSCHVSAPTWACPNRCKWRPLTSPGRPWNWTWFQGAVQSPWQPQPFTWPRKRLLRRRHRKVRENNPVVYCDNQKQIALCWCPWYMKLFSSHAEIGDIAGVADVTIRQSYRLIYPRAADLFPPDFKFDTPVDKLPQLWTPMCPTLTALCTFRIFALFSLKFALKAQAFWKDNGRIRQSAEDTFQY